MKKILSGRLYDTGTAKAVSREIEYGSVSEPVFYGLRLYRKRNGEYFLLRSGWRGVDDAILPQTYADAQEWAVGALDADEYQALFGAVSEGDDNRTTLTLSVSATVAEKARRAAAKQGVSLSAYVASLIEEEK